MYGGWLLADIQVGQSHPHHAGRGCCHHPDLPDTRQESGNSWMGLGKLEVPMDKLSSAPADGIARLFDYLVRWLW